MAGFRIDMSPLERSSMNIGSSLVNVGNTIGGAMQRSNQREQQAQSQEEAEALMRKAISGDPASLEELMVKSPQAAHQVAQYIQSQQAGQQAKADVVNAEKLKANQATVQKLFRIQSLPQEQRAAELQAVIANPTDDFYETDLPYMDDPAHLNSKAVEFFGADDAKAMFGVVGESKTKYQQGTGDMAGHVFNPDNGTFSINPEIKAGLDALSAKPELNFKDRQGLNKDITNLTKETKLIRNTASDLDKLSKVRSGPSAIAMIFKFMKALDPTSVVRESEFAMAESAAGMPEAIKNTFDKVWAGEKLGDEQIRQFVATAKDLANNAINSSGAEVNSFLDTFEGTIPESFKKKIKDRLPKPFGLKKKDTKAVNWADL